MTKNNDVKDNDNGKLFKILVCLDGTPDSYRGLRYAARIGSGADADITLLYVRQADKELHAGGLYMRMARENMLDWGLELPGMLALRQGRDMLKEMGYLDADWLSQNSHTEIQGDPLGDNTVEYTSKNGQKVILKLKVSPSPEFGILDESEAHDYDITIVSSSSPAKQGSRGVRFGDSVSQVVATESKNTVIVAKSLEENHGHLLCINGSPSSFRAARRDAMIASRCYCPIYLYCVAADEDSVHKSQAILDKARKIIEVAGYGVSGEKVVVGNRLEKIVEEGRQYSLIVLSGEHKTGWRRFFKSNFLYRILAAAHNSVMISR